MTGFVMPLQLVCLSLWLLHVLSVVFLKATVLLALAVLLQRVMRGAPARFRHVLWLSAIGGCLVILVLSLSGRLLAIPGPWWPAAGPAAALSTTVVLPSGGVGPSGDLSPFVARIWRRVIIGETWPSLWPPIVMSALVAGAAWKLGRMALGRMRLAVFERRGTLFSIRDSEPGTRQLFQTVGKRRKIRVIECMEATTSFTHGTLTPVIVLPAAMRRWPVSRRRNALLHELCHIRRADSLSLVIADCICALLWFVPLIPLAYSHLCLEQEKACDAAVIERGAGRKAYAACILRTAVLCRQSTLLTGLNLAGARKKALKERIQAIVEGGERMKKGLVGLGVSVLLLGAAVTLSAAGAETKGKVLMVLRSGYPDAADFMLSQEAAVMKLTLEDAGYTVVVATVDGKPLAGPSLSFKADIRMADARVADYKGVIVPCMAAAQSPVPAEAVDIVKKAMAAGKPLAAQNSAVLVLHEAGVIRGRRLAIEEDLASAVSEATYGGIGVVQDGTLVTSGTCPVMAEQLGKPDGTQQLTRTLIAMMK